MTTVKYQKEFTLEVKMRCTNPGTPGNLVGPPEQCYPPEPAEFEVEHVHLLSDDGAVLEHLPTDVLDEDDLESLNELAIAESEDS